MQKTIPSLNGLRAISIIMVIAYHYYQNNYFPDTKLIRYAGMFLCNGPLAVNIFFIISGFLITTLLLKEENEEGTISLKNFYIRRAIRILPAYYFLLFIYFLLQSVGYLKLSPIGWLSILFFAKQFHFDFHETAHLWSLSVEEFFYLAWPLLFIKTRTFNATIIALLISTVIIIRFLKFSFPLPPLMDSIFIRGDALLIGCLFAIKYERINFFISRMKNYVFFIFPLLTLFILTYNILYKLMLTHPHNNSLLILISIAYNFLGSIGLFTNILIGLIILFSINNNNLWSRLLNTSIMNHIGKLSYSLYLWQQLFTSEKPLVFGLPLLVSISAIYALGCFSYYLIEKPFLKFRKHFVSVPNLSINRNNKIESLI